MKLRYLVQFFMLYQTNGFIRNFLRMLHVFFNSNMSQLSSFIKLLCYKPSKRVQNSLLKCIILSVSLRSNDNFQHNHWPYLRFQRPSRQSEKIVIGINNEIFVWKDTVFVIPKLLLKFFWRTDIKNSSSSPEYPRWALLRFASGI